MTSPPALTPDLEDATRAIHRVRWIAVTALACVLVAAVAAGAVIIIEQQAQIRRDEARQHASCAFYGDIGSAKITPPPGAKSPTRLGVTIVADARNAFAGQSCPGHMKPPDPVLVHWARVYRITLRG